MARCLSVKPPEEPAMRIGRFADGVVPFAVPFTTEPLLVRALFAGLGGIGNYFDVLALGLTLSFWRFR